MADSGFSAGTDSKNFENGRPSPPASAPRGTAPGYGSTKASSARIIRSANGRL